MSEPARTEAVDQPPAPSLATSAPMRKRNTARPWFVMAVACGAFALRLVHLGVDSLWYDESVSTMLAGQPAAELIAHTVRDIHPPAYYLLLRGWLLLVGFPTGHADATGYRLEFMAGFLSLCLGVLLVPLTWQLARQLRLGDQVAALSAVLVAVSPFGVWYSQEVRMYTLGACLAVLCLLATVPFILGGTSRRKLIRSALVFALAAAAGMATLYYFVFFLISLNLLAIAVLVMRRRKAGKPRPLSPVVAEPVISTKSLSETSKSALVLWLGAQAGAVVLYLPWLPIAWRQATDPPVPSWRTAPQLAQALVESWNALTVGQSVEPGRLWPLLLVALALVVAGVIAAWKGKNRHRTAAALLLTAVFGPLALILLASTITPLYHVRYLFTFSAPFSILLALGVLTVAAWRPPAGRWLAAGTLFALLAGAAFSLRAFWTAPTLAADDLRSATRELAQRWRPGDAILVNAGYTYPAVLTYWPGPIAWLGRLSDYTQNAAAQAATGAGPVILQTGHVDGDAGLGWGDPRSDFYAMPADVMREKLAEVAQSFPRLWHYRLYDTVNDPQGVIRKELEAGWALLDDRVYAGEANLRVQGWQGMQQALSSYLPPTAATFDGWLELALAPGAVSSQVEAGGFIDVPRTLWRRLPDHPGQPLALSLRLVDAAGEIWAAADEPLGGNQLDLSRANELGQPLRLAVPAGVAPGRYELALVVYDPQTGQPLPAITPAGVAGASVTLGPVDVMRPAQPPVMQPALANFGPLWLVEAATPAATVSAGDEVPLSLLWQTAPGYRPEPLIVVVQLLDKDGRVVASLEEEPLAGRYPSSDWQAGELVQDRHALVVPAGTPPGTYRLIAGLYRAADGQRLSSASGSFGLVKSDFTMVQEITVR